MNQQAEDARREYEQVAWRKKKQALATQQIVEQQMDQERERKFRLKTELLNDKVTLTNQFPIETEEVTRLFKDKKVVEQE